MFARQMLFFFLPGFFIAFKCHRLFCNVESQYGASSIMIAVFCFSLAVFIGMVPVVFLRNYTKLLFLLAIAAVFGMRLSEFAALGVFCGIIFTAHKMHINSLSGNFLGAGLVIGSLLGGTFYFQTLFWDFWLTVAMVMIFCYRFVTENPRWFYFPFLLLIPYSVIYFSDLPKQPTGKSELRTASALPALLVGGNGEKHPLFIADRYSEIPEVWADMPFVRDIAFAGARNGRYFSDKIEFYNLNPGLLLYKNGAYNLIYVADWPGAPADKRKVAIAGELLKHVKDNLGVVILPKNWEFTLPAGVRKITLPGSDGQFVAYSYSPELSDNLEKLDERLQSYNPDRIEFLDVLPAGVLPALYRYYDQNVLPEVARPAAVVTALRINPLHVAIYIVVVAAVSLWYLGRKYLRGAQNSCALGLVLVAGFADLQQGELFFALSALSVIGFAGFFFVRVYFRENIERTIAFLGLLVLPALLFLDMPDNAVWVICLLAAFAAGLVNGNTLTAPNRFSHFAANLIGFNVALVIHTYCPGPLALTLALLINLRMFFKVY